MRDGSFKVLVLLALAASMLLTPEQGHAQRARSCGCYCGKVLSPPCSDAACKAACGYVEPRSGGGAAPYSGGGPITPGPDYGAEQRAREEAERRREEAERREQERLQAERQRQFERDRDAGAKSLKGGVSTGSFGLKGVDPANSGLRGPGERVDRDLTGKQAAWKQLHCAASILGPALAALTPPPGREPDFAESRYLLGEAQNALNGQRLGVQCAAAPAMPQISGRAPDTVRAVDGQRRLIERASAAVDRLEQAQRARTPDEERIARVYAQQQVNEAAHEKKIAPIREEQRQINRERDKKAGQPATPPAAQEAQARREIEQVAQVAKKIEQGDPTALGELISREEAPKRRRGGAAQ